MLLALERMRMIDQANSWSVGTHKVYQSKFRVCREFEGKFGVRLLRNTPVAKPPASEAIPLMWAQQYYSLKRSTSTRAAAHGPLALITVRGLRSAASMFHKMDLQVAFPGAAILDSAQRAVAVRHCSPTDDLSYALMSSGMASRIGEDSIPAEALLANHVRYLDASLERMYQGPLSPAAKLEIARAGFPNCNLWCAWLRAGESFGLRHCDVTRTKPVDGPTQGLPPGIGCLEERLAPATKTSRTRTADMVVAYTTGSGLSPGVWYDRILAHEGLTDVTADACDLPICRALHGSQVLVFQKSFGRAIATDVVLVSMCTGAARAVYAGPRLQRLIFKGDGVSNGPSWLWLMPTSVVLFPIGSSSTSNVSKGGSQYSENEVRGDVAPLKRTPSPLQ
jgi:hypothetical protein